MQEKEKVVHTFVFLKKKTSLGIIKEPIKLTVYSPDCPDLTIIDLPGITKIPLKDSD